MISDCNFPNQETSITIPGAVGLLDAKVVGPEKSDIKSVGIVCHPHPLYEGTMNNKVVTTLARVFRELGLAVVRFNFRGVGKSQGSYGKAVGEVDDLMAVINWIEKVCPDRSIWLAGFSFGAYIAAKVATQKQIEKLILVAPPVNHFDFASLPSFSSPTWVVQGDQDEIVPAQEVYAWVKSLTPPPHLIRLPNTSHFFHKRLEELRNQLIGSLK
jgi:alpha/beta superfamily hydrolase